MKLKEFIKPTILKIIISLVLTWFVSGAFYNYLCSCAFEPWMCGPIYCKNPIILVGFLIIPVYLFSCLLFFIYNKIRK